MHTADIIDTLLPYTSRRFPTATPNPILLREGRRVNGRVVKRTIANLTSFPDAAIDVLRPSLKGVSLCDAKQALAVKSTVPTGQVKAIRKAMERLGMAELVSSKPCRERDPSDAPLFTKGHIAEISHPDFLGERLVACFNPFLQQDRTRTRNELLAATEAKRRRKPWSDAELGEKIGRRKMAKHFTFEVKDGTFIFARNEASITREQALDGIYVIRTSEPAERLSAPVVVPARTFLSQLV